MHEHPHARLGRLDICLFLTKWSLGLYQEVPAEWVLDVGPIQFTWWAGQ